MKRRASPRPAGKLAPGLAERRLLGEIMRARKVAHFQSQKARGAL